MKTGEYRRCGYTILELMISLVLLATLMTVAWSILGSYRVAEERGWNQAYQMQVIRITRDWLEADAACLMESRVSVNSSENESRPTELKPFRGDEQGFEVDVIPSVDPLSWLEEITRVENPLTTTTQLLTMDNRHTAVAIDPLAVHRLRYVIIADKNSIDSEEETFELRRELVPIDRRSNISPSASSEKLLTAADLYRMTEDSPTESGVDEKSPATSIRNLVTPRFRYSDGTSWLSQWDSHLEGGLPRAIELSFDLPAASSPYEAAALDATETEVYFAEDFASNQLSTETVFAAEVPVSAADDDEALSRDVRVIVLVVGSATHRGDHE